VAVENLAGRWAGKNVQIQCRVPLDASLVAGSLLLGAVNVCNSYCGILFMLECEVSPRPFHLLAVPAPARECAFV
jgi:hypothetical protein